MGDVNTDIPAHAATGHRKADGGDAIARDRSSPSSDRDLLFGRLAVLTGFVHEEAVETARQQVESSKTIAEVLVESGAITEETRRAIEQLLELRVTLHGDDPQQSLLRLASPTVSFADPSAARTVTSAQTAAGGKPASASFGDYEIIDPIAEGGMGVVYKARQTKLNRLVALKMIRSGELADEEQIERFYSEAKAAAKLDHPGIVPVYEVGQQNGQHFFSMAFVEGVSLHEKVKDDGPLPSKRAAELIRSIAEAVQFAHERGIVHRDLKPANVLLASGGRQPAGDVDSPENSERLNSPKTPGGLHPPLAAGIPRITDFGLAKHGDSEMTVAGQIMGTPSYMPPEQAEGKQDEIGPVSDVYSLGATLYYVLTGRPPFQAASPTDTLRQVVNDEPVPPRNLNSDIPRDLETICLKCLRKERHSRYATAQDFVADLSRWLENKPIVARRVSAIEKTWLWCKRKPVVVGSAVTVLLVIGIAAYITYENKRQAAEAAIAQEKKAEEENNRTRAEELVVGLKKADIEQVPTAVTQLKDFRQWADPILKKQIAESRDGSGEKLRLSLALLPQDERQVGYLQSELLQATPAALPVIRDALKPHQKEITASLWKVLEDDQRKAEVRFNAACALATFDGENKTKWKPVLPFVAGQLVESIGDSLSDTGRFLAMLKPIRGRLAQPVSLIVRDTSKTELQQDIALTTVLDYAKDDPQQLADVLAFAERRQYAQAFEALKTLQDADQHLAAVLEETWSEETPENEKERTAKRQANAAVALLKLRKPGAVWPLLKHSPDPRTRSYIIHSAAELDVDPQLFVSQFDTESDITIRRALLLALGEFDKKQLPVEQRQPLMKKLLTIYETDPDPGTHSCTAWLLRKWGHVKSIKELTQELQANEEQRKTQMKESQRRWYVTTQGLTIAVLRADVFRMGSPKSEPDREDRETPHLRKIGRTFAIATHEVTRDQFMEFLKEIRGSSNAASYLNVIRKFVRTPDSPATIVTWYEAAAYCNWLSQKEEIPEDQWCYEKSADGKYAAGMKAKKNYLELTGYRLPSEAEWEYACRAETITSRYYGLTETLLSQYARYAVNGEKHTWPVGGLKPNGFGLFDMQGNAMEWCHDSYAAYDVSDPKKATPENLHVRPVTLSSALTLRGGSFTYQPSFVRSAYRAYSRPSNRLSGVGFRPSRTYP